MTTSAYGLPSRPSAPREFASSVVTIMTKELRSRFRGKRAFVVLTIYLGLLALIAWGVYTLATASTAFGTGVGTPSATTVIGQSIFAVLSAFELLLICFIAPGFTAGAISLEREKQTLDLLVSTPMRPGAIVVGKLLAALTFILLMITAAIPLNAIVFLYGGVTVADLVRQQLVLLIAALGLGSTGLFFSSLIKRTQAATVLTYCAMLAFTVGSVLVFFFWTAMANRQAFDGPVPEIRRAPEQLVYLNPAIAMADVISEIQGADGGIGYGLDQFRSDPPQFNGLTGDVTVECRGNSCFSDGQPVPCAPDGTCPRPGAAVARVQVELSSGYFWPRFVISWLLLSVLLTLLSMRAVVPAGMAFVFGRGSRRPPTPTVAMSGDGNPVLEEIE
jgi:ABC-type transport system involved in multi-copper enzyme maturation permease subunit